MTHNHKLQTKNEQRRTKKRPQAVTTEFALALRCLSVCDSISIMGKTLNYRTPRPAGWRETGDDRP